MISHRKNKIRKSVNFIVRDDIRSILGGVETLGKITSEEVAI